ncbi:hypothetical protein DPMN_130067 [Dreissena polymorpha]|uniref:Uncharacterized protein n=1 Tax=Dreissena polymorpha TaxID=45954 RepID=A0A9D4H6Y1_DREPO|nr:hypothetical protein DPMN_130067 [Dreissena polymorpha]
MPVASQQGAGLPMYRSNTGTLPAFIGASPGHHRRQPGRCRSAAGVCMGPGGAAVPSRFFQVPSRLFPVPRRSLPILPADSRSIKRPRSSPVHPGRPRWSPGSFGRSRITHRGSTGIIARLGLKVQLIIVDGPGLKQ